MFSQHSAAVDKDEASDPIVDHQSIRMLGSSEMLDQSTRERKTCKVGEHTGSARIGQDLCPETVETSIISR